MTLSSASSYSSQPSTWDAFLSFYGKDTRGNFISHLYKALDQAGIVTFRDDPALEKGEQISSGLLNAIKNSKMFVVVISENYARSRWCLDELAEILSCERTENRVVPIFYNVDPSDVRYQKGSVGEALEAHKKHYSDDMIEKWTSGLSQIADLSGHHVRKDTNEDESEIIQEIIVKVAQASTKILYLDEHLFGIDSAVEEIRQKLRMELDDVRGIGICGMGGIGKTTTAKAFYNKYSNIFEVSCFIENVKQYSEGCSPLLPLLEGLLTELLRKKDFKVTDVASGIRQLTQILTLKKALIVLDDLDQSSYSQFLVKMHNLVQDMGRELGKRTRLCWQGNAWNDLRNQVDLDKIEGLIIDLTQSTEKQINSRIFEKLPKLRLLEIFNAHAMKGHFKRSFHELRCIYWSHCTWKKLPCSFQPQKLVLLHMPYSNLEMLWNGAMPFKSLKMLNLGHSVNLKMTPDFGNSKSVERLGFGGCESLLKLHPSIRELTGLCILDLRECTRLKELAEPHGHITILSHVYSCVKRSPQPMKQWANIGCLYLGHLSNLRRLPEQLGDMKGLKKLDASHTAIEELPDSITQLKELYELELSNCKKLTELPEEIGNMKGLRIFKAGNTAINKLPDSFVGLINLVKLDLSYCKNLRSLPNDFWKLKLLMLNLGMCSKLKRLPVKLRKMQCLKYLNASVTAIKKVPSSIKLLSKLEVLDLGYCEKLKYVPNSVWKLPSLTQLFLMRKDMDISGKFIFPGVVKDRKMVGLSLNCNIRLWLPLILSFSSLKTLVLCDQGESLSSSKPFSLSKLENLQFLELYECKSVGSSFPELPPSLAHLSLCSHATLVHLPNLSSLKQLKRLDVAGYLSLKSLPRLPPYLQSLTVYDCTSLIDLPNMSVLKDLLRLSFGRCGDRRSIGLKSFLQVAEWFSYKSSERTLCFDIPPLLGDNFLGLALWVLFTSKTTSRYCINAVVTNKTNGISNGYFIPVFSGGTGVEVYSLARCIHRDKISIKSGDRIEILFERRLYGLYGEIVPLEEVKMEMCAAHVIQKSPITPDFPSVLNNFITGV